MQAGRVVFEYDEASPDGRVGWNVATGSAVPTSAKEAIVRTRDAHSGLETFDREACMALLGTERIGRLAVVDGFSPVVFPVNYAMDGEDIVFRVADGTKLRSAGRANACFEIDAFDPDRRSGWSVVVVGRLEEVTPLDPAYERTSRLPLDPWAEGDRRHLLRLVASRVTGRRVRGGATS